MMLEGSGFNVVDLGTDVASQRFADAVRDGADVVALSALLTTTMTSMKDVVEAISWSGLRDRVRIVIGGAPITAKYASEIGANGYAPGASKAVRKLQELLSVQQPETKRP
jgi:5-methyltetrahydrofolate--homocysteine methyltransferase